MFSRLYWLNCCSRNYMSENCAYFCYFCTQKLSSNMHCYPIFYQFGCTDLWGCHIQGCVITDEEYFVKNTTSMCDCNHTIKELKVWQTWSNVKVLLLKNHGDEVEGFTIHISGYVYPHQFTIVNLGRGRIHNCQSGEGRIHNCQSGRGEFIIVNLGGEDSQLSIWEGRIHNCQSGRRRIHNCQSGGGAEDSKLSIWEGMHNYEVVLELQTPPG